MAIDIDERGRAFSAAIDATGTIAVWKLPGGSIERSFETTVHIDPDASFDYRVDVGVLPTDVDEPMQESDVHWFRGVVTKSKSDDNDEIVDFAATETYIRLVVTSAAVDGSEATLALTVGRRS